MLLVETEVMNWRTLVILLVLNDELLLQHKYKMTDWINITIYIYIYIYIYSAPSAAGFLYFLLLHLLLGPDLRCH